MKRGEEVLIFDRKVPVARIVPVTKLGARDTESRLDDLERRGVLRRAKRRPDAGLLDQLGPPPAASADVVAAVLAEREEGW